MTDLIQRFTNDESGATAIEYGLIAAGVAVVVVGAMTTLSPALEGIFGQVTDGLGGTVEGAGGESE
ncbi:MAG: Flp family type IVb pilin [Paracoccaceae bacterium]